MSVKDLNRGDSKAKKPILSLSFFRSKEQIILF